jgi:hypothetical protein
MTRRGSAMTAFVATWRTETWACTKVQHWRLKGRQSTPIRHSFHLLITMDARSNHVLEGLGCRILMPLLLVVRIDLIKSGLT